MAIASLYSPAALKGGIGGMLIYVDSQHDQAVSETKRGSKHSGFSYLARESVRKYLSAEPEIEGPNKIFRVEENIWARAKSRALQPARQASLMILRA